MFKIYTHCTFFIHNDNQCLFEVCIIWLALLPTIYFTIRTYVELRIRSKFAADDLSKCTSEFKQVIDNNVTNNSTHNLATVFALHFYVLLCIVILFLLALFCVPTFAFTMWFLSSIYSYCFLFTDITQTSLNFVFRCLINCWLCIFLLTLLISVAVFLYEICIILFKQLSFARKAYLLLLLFKIALFSYIKLYHQAVFTQFFEVVESAKTQGWLFKSLRKVEYIITWQPLHQTYCLLLVILFVYIFTITHSIWTRTFTVVRFSYIKTLLLNLFFDFFMFVMFLTPELPIVFFNGGYDMVCALIRYQSSTAILHSELVVTANSSPLNDRYITLFTITIFNFICCIYAVIVNIQHNISQHDVTGRAFCKAWLTTKFWQLIFIFSAQLHAIYCFCIVLWLYFDGINIFLWPMILHLNNLYTAYIIAVEVSLIIWVFLMIVVVIFAFIRCIYQIFIKFK